MFQNIIIFSEGKFNIFDSKFASGIIKYSKYNILAIIDSQSKFSNCFEVLGIGENIPIIKNLKEALFRFTNIDTLLLGIAPAGGALPPSWRNDIILAIKSKLNIISGLHLFLSEDREFSELAQKNSVYIWDVRKYNGPLNLYKNTFRNPKNKVILTVGTDCNLGKMSTILELDKYIQKNSQNINSIFVPTGQTGVVISGWGIAIDAIKIDFVSGIVEKLVLESINRLEEKKELLKNNNLILLEGQGSLINPAYSNTTLSLIHGSMPDFYILCHYVGRTKIRNYDLDMPNILDIINLYNNINLLKKTSVIAISLNTYGLSDKEAQNAILEYEKLTNLPVTDPVRFGPEILYQTILKKLNI